ncbi:hypothetical protein [Pseudarthrobacter sp. H2]|uniref:hypothetical protein n=1 Tax=Pseudarthrobacter sp. H2 TaxID=3418415 RepID=UPI003CF96D36
MSTEESPADKTKLLREAASTFLSAAFAALTEEHVLPIPRWRPHLHVGRDYEGSALMFLPEFERFTKVLKALYTHRLDRPLAEGPSEYSNHYAFVLLEACIAEFARSGESYDPDSNIVDGVIDDLIAVLEAEEYELVCCRAVSHLTTEDGSPAQVGRFLISPELEPAGTSRPLKTVIGMIPSARRAFDHHPPSAYDPPISVVTVSETTKDKPQQVMSRLSGDIERFLLLTRLVYGATTQSHWQIVGPSTRVGRIDPVGKSFVADGAGPQFVQRVATLSEAQQKAFDSLDRMLDSTEVVRKGKVTTSFDMAVHRFSRSYANNDVFDAVVDLATAMEAILLGGSSSKSDVGLRLKLRAAALLAIDNWQQKMIRDQRSSATSLPSTTSDRHWFTGARWLIRKWSSVSADCFPTTRI